MPNVTRWEPFRDLASFRDDINRLWTETLSRWPEGGWRGGWNPAIDMHETDADVVITAEVPGVTRDQIELSVTTDSVTIAGQTEGARQEADKERHYHRQERYFGQFSRTVQLPTLIDPARAMATFHDGLLTITLPKSEEHRPKKIPIQPR
ncbi:MAG TPA: Hsp20/alpha crystallin family protein [Bacillota bacterium]|jgi:HSP20 family protein